MQQSKHLHILWTNADAETAQYMVMMYATNSKLNAWWQEVTVIIWGATARLAVQDEAIRQRIQIAQQAGVKFSACVACARQLGVDKELAQMGVEVKGWGQPLTELIQEGAPLLTL